MKCCTNKYEKTIIISSFLFAAIITCAIWSSCKKEEIKGKIYGTVTNFTKGEPVGNVNVKLKPSGETTLTGSDGCFEFSELDAGNYSLSLSKAGFADVDDDYVIELKLGKEVKRDLQIRKQIASLQIKDMVGNSISSLDFGLDESVTSKSFNIFNDGTETIICQLSYNCVWIDTIFIATTTIPPDKTVAVTVVIDREKLVAGENRTFLHIISNNGSNDLELTAIGYDLPTVTTNDANEITTTSAKCGGNITSNGGNTVSERSICWSTNHAPNIDRDEIMRIGNGDGSFFGVISGLTMNTTYYVRAYAINNRGIAYGGEIQFKTSDGTPIVTTITPTKTGTTVTTGGRIESDEGSSITARGICYGLTPYPDLSNSHNHTENGSGTGTYSSSFEMNSMGAYYVRAYATNSRGTSYGEQCSINHPYNDMPTFSYGGQTFRVAPISSSTMTWSQAVPYCDNLTLYGYSDWRLPNIEELGVMINCGTIEGMRTGICFWTNYTSGSGSTYYYYGYYSDYYNRAQIESTLYSTTTFYVRPIRIEN